MSGRTIVNHENEFKKKHTEFLSVAFPENNKQLMVNLALIIQYHYKRMDKKQQKKYFNDYNELEHSVWLN